MCQVKTNNKTEWVGQTLVKKIEQYVGQVRHLDKKTENNGL